MKVLSIFEVINQSFLYLLHDSIKLVSKRN